MIRYLLVLQFPFLFLTSLFAGLGVYWMGRSVVGFYVANLLVLVSLHMVLCRIRKGLSSTRAAVAILLAGVAVASWVYGPLHLGSWEQSSIVQALKLGALGIISLLASHLGAQLRAGRKHSLAAALALVGLLWIPALEYPLIPLLLVGLVQAAALPLVPAESHEPQPVIRDAKLSKFISVARYAVLLTAVALGDTIFDYQQNTHWAGHLATAFLAAALGAFLATRKPRHALGAGVALVSATYLATVLFPDFVLHPAHATGSGLALGAVLAYLDRLGGAAAVIGSTFFWGLGLILSVVLAQNLAIAEWRAALLGPLLILLLRLLPRPGQALHERT